MSGLRARLVSGAAVLVAPLLVLSLSAGPPTAGASVAATPSVAGPALGTAAPGAGDAGRPLVIVLDTSGSMQEDDGSGTIKLAGAQAALSQVIREQRPGSTLGLWTYPNDGACGTGAFAIDVGILQQREMIGEIRGLTAGGETPTGGALRDVVEQLKADGYEGATILLISDGLSTCDPDPCQVAEEITAEGFDLTVQAAGFQISPEGMAELECIADATGGRTYEATDADQLGEVTADATRAELAMTVEGIPARAPAGSATRVTVTVTNPSAVDVLNARVAFNFANAVTGATAVVPAVLPPLFRFGNIPAGDSKEHTWVVSYGSRGKTGEARYRLAAWGSNAQPRTREGVVEVVDVIQGLENAGGLMADLDGKRIAILGDSYSSGEGGSGYLEGTSENGWFGGNQCHRSPNTYLYSLFGDTDVELLACSGATTHYIGDDENGVREDQVDRLATVQEDRGAVSAGFMTVGGNDIGFSGIIAQCLLGHPTASATWTHGIEISWDNRCSDDESFKRNIYQEIADVGIELRTTYRQISDRLNRTDFVDERDGDIAPLYVLAYPQPFPEQQWVTFCRGFDAYEVGFANDLVDRLNAKIEESVAQVRRQGYRVQMITTTQETFLPDNTACPRPRAQEYMHSIDALEGIAVGINYLIKDPAFQQFVHPNALGYQAETNTILQWSVAVEDELPDGVHEWRTAPDDGWWSQVVSPSTVARALTPRLPAAGPAVLDAATGTWESEPLDARGGQRIEVRVVNAAPGSTVRMSMASRQRAIGSIDVAEDGTATGFVVVPRRAASGTHQLLARGLDADNNPMTASQEIDVARAIPFWLTPLAVLTLLSFLLAGLLGRRDRRTRARAVLSGTR